MKTLIENTIKIKGIGNPSNKTIFTIEDESERKDLYFSIELISGRKLTIEFKYLEDGLESFKKIFISIPFQLNEEQVKSFILGEITTELNS